MFGVEFPAGVGILAPECWRVSTIGCQPPGDAAGKMFGEERALPHRGLLQPVEDDVRIASDGVFEGPPETQRNVPVRNVLFPPDQLLENVERLGAWNRPAAFASSLLASASGSVRASLTIRSWSRSRERSRGLSSCSVPDRTGGSGWSSSSSAHVESIPEIRFAVHSASSASWPRFRGPAAATAARASDPAARQAAGVRNSDTSSCYRQAAE